MNSLVTIVDYGMGNIHSVKQQIHRAGSKSIVSSDADEILNARKLVLPGVGSFGKAMDNLKRFGLVDALNEVVIQKKVPTLGICLGMQLMAKHSSEGDVSGLGWFDGVVVRFDIDDKLRFKVPHMGWNEIKKSKESLLLSGISDNSEFYFVHSFHFKTDTADDVLSNTTYSYAFPSSIERDNVFGVQFHPEKSHENGRQIFKNFIAI